MGDVSGLVAMEDDFAQYRARLAHNVRRFRELQRLTQRQLAEDVGSPVSQVWTIEHGRHNVRLDTLIKIAAGLKVDIRDLFGPITE